MNTKSDWQTVNEQLMAENRRRLGEPPTDDEILAYTRGELSVEEEERMREHLVCHPELLRALAVQFPAEGAAPGDPDSITDEEWPAHWAALQKRMVRGRVVDFRRHAWTALAAVVALAFAGLYWQAEWKARRPHVIAGEVTLLSDARRGPAGPPQTLAHWLDESGHSVVLTAVVSDPQEHDAYRVAILDANGSRALWRSERVQPRDDQRVAIVVPRSFLLPGNYRIVLYGLEGSREETLAIYSVHVPDR
jgi:hypothetical protein